VAWHAASVLAERERRRPCVREPSARSAVSQRRRVWSGL